MDSNAPLAELVDRIRQGDKSAFDALADRYRRRLKTLIRFRLGEQLRTRLDPEDVLQETLLRAFRGARDFEWTGPGCFVAWLTTIAENVCREMLRRHLEAERNSLRREVSLAPPTDAGGSVRDFAQILSAGGPGPSTAFAREERLQRLERALEALEPQHREVLILSLIQEIPTAEIGRRLDMTSGAVCMLRSRALKKLREHFGHTDSLHLADRPIAASPPPEPGDAGRELDSPA